MPGEELLKAKGLARAGDVVLMGAGSVGVESFVRGKPVVSFCARSYWFHASGATHLDPARMQDWPTRIEQALKRYRDPSASERAAFIKACLRSTMRMARPGRRWPLAEPDDLRSTLRTAVLAGREVVN